MIIVWGAELSYVGTRGIVAGFGGGSAASVVIPASARGNIDFDQIRVAARTGNGTQLLTWNSLGPGAHTSTGVAGQIAYDSSGNVYVCYATNSWLRIGPAGYSNSF